MVAFAPSCRSHRPAERVVDEGEVVGLDPCWLWQVVGMRNNRGETRLVPAFPKVAVPGGFHPKRRNFAYEKKTACFAENRQP